MVFLCHHKRTKLTDIFDSKNDKVAMYAHDAHEEESEVAMSLACLESVLWEDKLLFPSVNLVSKMMQFHLFHISAINNMVYPKM